MGREIIKWLHLSDIHYLVKNYETERMRNEFFCMLKQLQEEESFTHIFITGDITDKNGSYENADTFILGVAKKLSLDSNRVYLVPGNHDVNRKQLRQLIIEGLYHNVDEAFSRSANLEEESVDFLKNFEYDFIDFYEKIKGSHPKSKVHFVERDDDICIIHLDTAWLSGYEKTQDFMTLNIGENHLLKIESLETIERNKPILLLAHHTIDYMSEKQKQGLENFMNKFKVNFYLCGHTHESKIWRDGDIGTIYCVCGQNKCDAASASFCVGQLDLKTKEGSIKFFSWNEKKSNWTPDMSLGFRAPFGEYLFNLDKLRIPGDLSDKDVVLIHKTMNHPINEKNVALQVGINKPAFFCLQEEMPDGGWKEFMTKTDTLVKNVFSAGCEFIMHIFALSQIPLLIHLGYLLQRDRRVKIYQYSRNEARWVYERGEKRTQKIYVDVPKGECLDVILKVEVSGNIDDNDIAEAVGSDLDAFKKITISVESPDVDRILYREDVDEFLKKYDSEIVKTFVGKNIHVFYAGPAGLAVELGRRFQKSMIGILHLYSFNAKKRPKYEKAIMIDG